MFVFQHKLMSHTDYCWYWLDIFSIFALTIGVKFGRGVQTCKFNRLRLYLPQCDIGYTTHLTSCPSSHLAMIFSWSKPANNNQQPEIELHSHQHWYMLSLYIACLQKWNNCWNRDFCQFLTSHQHWRTLWYIVCCNFSTCWKHILLSSWIGQLKFTPSIDADCLSWYSKLKYLGCVLMSGFCKIDIPPAVGKYCAQFQSINQSINLYLPQ